MFTTEMDHDETKITILDDAGVHEDVIFNIYDDIVIIRQWDDTLENHVEIGMSPDMFDDFLAALNNPEGTYRLERKKEWLRR